MSVITKDLYCGAYLLSKGGLLEEIQCSQEKNGRICVHFVIKGDQIEEHFWEFQRGKGNTNIAAFKVAMNHLKDTMFNTLRDNGQA